MLDKQKAILVGDAMITGELFENAFPKYLGKYVTEYRVGSYESDWGRLQDRRLKVEQQGPEIETVPDIVLEEGNDATMLMGLFVPISSKLLDEMPDLKIAGVARAGLENVNIEEATKRGVLVFNVMGRNAEAVSDFAVGLILAEARNIARAHFSIKNGAWRKTFSNNDFIPQLKGKKIGFLGFGYIGKLAARKISGFEVERLVYDPFVSDEVIKDAGCIPVDKETLLRESDFVSLHMRLVDSTKNFIGKEELDLMKSTAYIINTSRAGLIDQESLINALEDKKIAGAGLDVFPNEPIHNDNPLLQLDNVTLTTHIAGTTTEALTTSPELLMEDIEKLLKGEEPRFIINPEVLNNNEFRIWLKGVREQ